MHLKPIRVNSGTVFLIREFTYTFGEEELQFDILGIEVCLASYDILVSF